MSAADALAAYRAERDAADKHVFQGLVHADRDTLLQALADTHEHLANLHEDIAYLRANESRLAADNKQLRIMEEGTRDALIEKKFLIIRLLDACPE